MKPHEWIAVEWVLSQPKSADWKVEHLARLGAVLTADHDGEW